MTPAASKQGPRRREEAGPVEIPVGAAVLNGDLTVPERAAGLVLFAHGSGSSRRSPRNRSVAEGLRREGFATLLMDLLTEEEGADPDLRFDMGMMTPRLEAATAWVRGHPATSGLPIGYFGASTGAAVALLAAAELGKKIRAVVSRGGRPDLVGQSLELVESPTLLIVGSRDDTVLDLNRRALALLACKEKVLEVVPGATHLFEEPGALEQVVGHAARWFRRYLIDSGGAPASR